MPNFNLILGGGGGTPCFWDTNPNKYECQYVEHALYAILIYITIKLLM